MFYSPTSRQNGKVSQRVLFWIGMLLLCIAAIGIWLMPTKHVLQLEKSISPTPTISPTLTPEPPFSTYRLPVIPKKDFYTIVMVGDSMTAALGPHGGQLSEYLNQLYQSTPGHQRILIDNYSQGSTNILEINHQMTTPITVGNITFDPLLSRQFDLILIESFGYNPLSQFPRPEGLDKQTQTLESTMKLLIKQHPQSAIVFVATIAPNKETYAENEAVGQLADRIAEAEERIAFIQNHMAFAKAHTIPLIDMFDPSLTPSGDGNLVYISASDHIHPSFAGIDFINHQIGDFIFNSKILPL